MELWDYTAAELIRLPVDALALLTLQAFEPSGWNVDSFFKEAEAHHSDLYRETGVPEALGDAWAWLEANALVGFSPRQSASPNARRVTSLGRELLATGDLGKLKAIQRLNVDLHPVIGAVARQQFLLGEFELAAFAALREVEIHVRSMGGFANDQVGVSLMALAFKVQPPGPLTDTTAEGGEQEAMMALFRGAIGTFKNPSSHRPVNYDNPTMAAEVVLLADLLMRLLDRIEAYKAGPPAASST
jgi:uncharacterized protein (TIGR02391 family)